MYHPVPPWYICLPPSSRVHHGHVPLLGPVRAGSGVVAGRGPGLSFLINYEDLSEKRPFCLPSVKERECGAERPLDREAERPLRRVVPNAQ